MRRNTFCQKYYLLMSIEYIYIYIFHDEFFDNYCKTRGSNIDKLSMSSLIITVNLEVLISITIINSGQ